MQAGQAYGPEDYSFPRLYVEGVESREYMLLDPATRTYKLSPTPQGGLALGKVVYEDAWELALDPVEARAARGFAVILPWRGYTALYVRPGTPLNLLEAHGVQVVFTVREGDSVGERSVLAYVLTGKGETRTIRAGVEGVVVLIAWEKGSHPPRYAVAVARGADVEEYRRA